MHLLIMGPPGAGKGTQADQLVKRLKIAHISTGDMFRQAIKEGTDLGKKAKEYMDAGKLVPDAITVGIVKERLGAPDCQKGFLLDGFPRTVQQAEALDAILTELGMPLDAVFNLEVQLEKLVARLTGRRVCTKCGANYHIEYNQPKEAGKCDQCNADLYHRSDDTEATVRSRLDVYTQQTQPLIDYYQVKGLVKGINGDQPISQVLRDIGKSLGRDWA
jgi:adenylate kinase